MVCVLGESAQGLSGDVRHARELILAAGEIRACVDAIMIIAFNRRTQKRSLYLVRIRPTPRVNAPRLIPNTPAMAHISSGPVNQRFALSSEPEIHAQTWPRVMAFA